MAGLFDHEIQENNSPVDTTEITTTILYYSKEQLADFKRLTKKGMKIKYPDDFKKRAYSDFLLEILKEKYEDL